MNRSQSLKSVKEYKQMNIIFFHKHTDLPYINNQYKVLLLSSYHSTHDLSMVLRILKYIYVCDLCFSGFFPLLDLTTYTSLSFQLLA